jgi:hypothetical protein
MRNSAIQACEIRRSFPIFMLRSCPVRSTHYPIPRAARRPLPQPLKQAIEVRTGPITGVRIASAGQNSPLAVIIDIRDGKVFVKGLPSAHRRVITQTREAAVAPLVRGISPSLLWHFGEAGWNVLGYQYAPGRHADYSRVHPTSTGWCTSWTR